MKYFNFIFFLLCFLFFINLNILVNSNSILINKDKIVKGKKYFNGEYELINKGNSCNSCHSIDMVDVNTGGSLAINLTKTYLRMGSNGIEAILKNPPYPAMKAAYENKKLTIDEISYLISYLTEISDKDSQYIKINTGLYLFFSSFFVYILLNCFYYLLFKKNKNKVDFILN